MGMVGVVVATGMAMLTMRGQPTLTITRRQYTMRGRLMPIMRPHIGDGATLQEPTMGGAALVGGAGSLERLSSGCSSCTCQTRKIRASAAVS
jgi:hypothetical protein